MHLRRRNGRLKAISCPESSCRSWKFEWSVWFRRNLRWIIWWPYRYFFFFFSSFSSSHLRRIYDRDVRGFFVVNRIAPREFRCSLIIGDYRQVKKGIFFVEDEISFGEGSGIIFYRKFLTETERGKESLYVELYESVYISIIWRGFYLFLPMDRNFYNGYKFVLLIWRLIIIIMDGVRTVIVK